VIVSHTIPDTMTGGETYPVSITVLNTGISSWTRDGDGPPDGSRGYKLEVKFSGLVPLGPLFGHVCHGDLDDCRAEKGVNYARINKAGQRYHVFGTHLDSGEDSDSMAVRHLSYSSCTHSSNAWASRATSPC
jgi:hypothetical protein